VNIGPLRRLALTFQSVLWPPVCFACGDRRRDTCLCDNCKRRLRPAPHPDLTLLEYALRVPVAQWEFDEEAPIRAVLHRLKYQNHPWIGRHLGKELGMSGLPPFDEAWDCIVPIPLHRLRLLERGYNQSEWIARGLAETLGIPLLKRALTRTRETAPQTSLARHLRRSNVMGAFRVPRACDLSGRRVLLVDDTLTTGATLESGARALLSAGAVSVQPVAVARAALRLDKEQGAPASVIGSRPSLFSI